MTAAERHWGPSVHITATLFPDGGHSITTVVQEYPPPSTVGKEYFLFSRLPPPVLSVHRLDLLSLSCGLFDVFSVTGVWLGLLLIIQPWFSRSSVLIWQDGQGPTRSL